MALLRLIPHRSRVLTALLLFCVLLFVPACGGAPEDGEDAANQTAAKNTAEGAAAKSGTENVDTGTKQTASKQAASKQDDGTEFVHRAGPENVSDNSTYIDHPLTNGNPDALVFVTRVQRPDEPGAENARQVGVWYDAGLERWAIFNQDREPMPEGAAFNVAIVETPAETVLVHRADSGNVSNNSTYLDYPLSNGNPDAVLAATANWNPGGEGGTYNDHAIGVWYDADRERWAIFNQDREPMPEGAAFNVAIAEEPDEAGLSVHRATPDNTAGDGTYLDLPAANGDPDAVLSVTPNWNPGGGGGTYHDHPVGVRYDAGRERWAVFNEDGAPVPEGAAFNVGGYSAVTTAAKAAKQAVSAQAAGGGEPIEGSGEPEAAPEYRDFFSKGNPETPEKLVSSDSSVGAIPAVAPFNFGKDPGGPEDKTLFLTVPKLGLEEVPVLNSTSEEALKKSAVHVPATGFPWQKGANTFIAGHRIGFPETGSYYIFFRMDELVEGDEIILTDTAGDTYTYRVFKQEVAAPGDVGIMGPTEGKSIVSLQTCTLPDYEERLIVQGELIGKST